MEEGVIFHLEELTSIEKLHTNMEIVLKVQKRNKRYFIYFQKNKNQW